SYDFNHEKRGCCVIINNDKFTDMYDRPGSSCDVKNMETEFRNLGFDVKIYNNLTASYIDKKLRKVSMKYDHEKADCFVCIILSHGEEHFDLKRERNDVIFGSDGHHISIAEIMERFSDPYCHGLLGKPRLFFIQACRGVKTEQGVDITIKSIKKVEVPVHPQKPIDRKKLIYSFSCILGYYAFRRESGTWFIKSLTYVLQNSLRSKTFQQMLTHVSYEMAMNYKSKNKKNLNIDGCVTIPCIMSMLTKDIYF
ncbi:hypothetical protein LOTGIDRAFT_73381, partial [Lottia gigantea]